MKRALPNGSLVAALLLGLILAVVQAKAQSVDPLTGNLQYGIPLSELSANDVTIPVGISQHGNALTVAEGEGDCGMGWSLSAGGSITRLVRGLPDDLDGSQKGWIKMQTQNTSIQNFSPTGDDVLSVCSDEASDFNFLNGLAYTYDTEPDLFFFNAPGISGQFILNASGVPQLLNLQDLTISNFRPDSFSIKTNRGMVYSFTTVESTDRAATGAYCDFADFQYNSGPAISFTSRWLLTRIKSTATGTTARLTYTTLPMALSVTQKEDSIYAIRDQFHPKRLASIELKTHKVEVSWSNQVITKIRMLETVTGNSKTFELYYKTFKDDYYHATNNAFPAAKTFLYKLREVGPNCNPYSSYEFHYAGVNWSREALKKPWKKNNKQDFFGYLTGRSGSHNSPIVYFYDSEPDGRRVRMTPLSGATLSHTTSGYDRTTDVDSVKFGALTKVVTPAGGTVEITWESNAYYDSAVFQNTNGGGVRVKKISMSGSDVAYGKSTDTHSPVRAITRSYEYVESNGTTSSGKLLAPLKFGYYTATGRVRTGTNKGDPSDIMYARVKEVVDTLGYTVYEFSIPGVFPQTQKYEWKSTKSRIARKSGTDCACDNYRNGFFAYPFAPSTNFGHRRGFLKSVSQYSNSGTLVRKREMTALQLPASPPAAIKAIRFEKSGANTFYYGVYEILTGRAQVVGTETSTEYPELGSTPIVTTTQYTYNSNHMLSQVTETLADGSTKVSNIKYVKDLPITGSPSQSAAIALKTLNETNRHGEMIEQTSFVTVAGGSPVLTDASFVAYKTFSNGKVLPAFLLTVPRGAAVTTATTSGSTLTTDSDYDTIQFFNDYDLEGRSLWESDKKKNTVSHSYSSAYGYEAATFANVKSGTSVYEGFETATTAGLTVTGGSATYPAGWTGDKAIDMTSVLTLTSASLTKGTTTHYRLSCWAKASAATTVYFKAQGGTLINIDEFSIVGTSQWQYYEKVVSATSVPSSFTLKVTSAGNVTIDDVLLVPAEARVAMQTARPLVGITSATDDRGNSVTFAYDEQGRKTGSFDRKRNLVQKVEYGTQKSLTSELVAAFTHNSSYLVTNSAVTFSASDHCSLQGATYSWVVDGATESTNSTLVKSFAVPGQHNVSLTVTKNGNSSNFVQDLCFDLGGSPAITAEDSQSNTYAPGFTANCNTPTLTFTAGGLPASGGGCTTTITWLAVNTIMVNGVPEINVLSQLGTGTSVSYAPATALTIQARVQINCSGEGNLACLGSTSNFFIIGFDINWENTTCN